MLTRLAGHRWQHQRTPTAAIIVCLSLLLSACNRAPPPPPTPKVSVAAVLAKDIADWDEFTGRLQAIDNVEIRPRVTGYIDRVAFAQGHQVRKGDLLFVIDARQYRAEVQRASADLMRARGRQHWPTISCTVP